MTTLCKYDKADYPLRQHTNHCMWVYSRGHTAAHSVGSRMFNLYHHPCRHFFLLQTRT